MSRFRYLETYKKQPVNSTLPEPRNTPKTTKKLEVYTQFCTPFPSSPNARLACREWGFKHRLALKLITSQLKEIKYVDRRPANSTSRCMHAMWTNGDKRLQLIGAHCLKRVLGASHRVVWGIR